MSDNEPTAADAPQSVLTEPDDSTPEATPEAAPKRSTGRRIAFWVGVGLILAGLGLLAYVAWQLWGTNWVSKREQREVATQLQEDWAAGNANVPEFGEASALIRIPKFGSKYLIPVIEGTSQDILAKGYGHFIDTAGPGQVGNYALAAHRVTHGEPLRRMPELRPGDTVVVETRTHVFTYTLDTNPNALVIPFTGTWVLAPVPDNPQPGGVEPNQAKGQRLITLTTCSEIFHTDNRMIAFGHLTKAKEKKVASTS